MDREQTFVGCPDEEQQPRTDSAGQDHAFHNVEYIGVINPVKLSQNGGPGHGIHLGACRETGLDWGGLGT